MNIQERNKLGLWAAALLLIGLVFNLSEGFGTVIYTNWWRQNIHWFTPILPVSLILLGLKNKESLVVAFLNLLIVIIHYGFLLFLWGIAKGGAAVLELL